MPTYFINQNEGYPKRPKVQVGKRRFFMKDNTATLELSTGGVSELFCDFYCTGKLSKREALALFYQLRAKAQAQMRTNPQNRITIEEAIDGKD